MDETKKTSKTKIKTVKEGLVEIAIPEFEKISSKAPVFYNPKMEFNRDISILALQRFQEEIKKSVDICDLFGGSGIRAIRYKKELKNVGKVSVNDISDQAIEFEKINSENNNMNLNLHQKEANVLLREFRGKFDIVDVDPFGTPSYFIDSLGYSVKKNSMVCITATDTSALCGTYIEPCVRKYNAKPNKTEYCHETGIRILIGFVALTFGKYKKYLEPKLTHSSQHYMRLYLKVKKSSKGTDESLNENIGYIEHCSKCLYRKSIKGLATDIDNKCPECGEKLTIAGPLWAGEVQDQKFIDGMIHELLFKNLRTSKKILKLLTTCSEEANSPITFYDIHKISKVLKVSAPKLSEVQETLKKEGFSATRTHFSPLGIKTECDINILKKIVYDLSTDSKNDFNYKKIL
ncbi:MAG: tRNA (guanine(26)-N(2))-dimethyltransferase [Methanobrevibacter sp.]|jgi:tRNA (guanine26-N2/guanine27-N2)-dimethyltransferase|nr:tRNA (guanine(26)-N(2))-dimethyltransferase [Candidatus Methanovirga aequatorialis]